MSLFKDIVRQSLTNEVIVNKKRIVDEISSYKKLNEDYAKSSFEKDEGMNTSNTSETDSDTISVASDAMKGGADELKKEHNKIKLGAAALDAMKKALEDGVITADEYTGDVKKVIQTLIKAMEPDVLAMCLSKLPKSKKEAIVDALDGKKTEEPTTSDDEEDLGDYEGEDEGEPMKPKKSSKSKKEEDEI